MQPSQSPSLLITYESDCLLGVVKSCYLLYMNVLSIRVVSKVTSIPVSDVTYMAVVNKSMQAYVHAVRIGYGVNKKETFNFLRRSKEEERALEYCRRGLRFSFKVRADCTVHS